MALLGVRNVHIGNGVPIPLESGGVGADGAEVRNLVAGVHHAVAVGVEVQVGGQLVARAGSGATHARHIAGVAGQVAAGGRARHPGAIAIQVVPDGVELGQVDHINQVVVVQVVVVRGWDGRELAGDVQRGAVVLQRRVLRTIAEVPRVIAAGLLVQVEVPVHIDAGAVFGGALQRGGGLALAAAGAGGLTGAGSGVVVVAEGYLAGYGAIHSGAHQTARIVGSGGGGGYPAGGVAAVDEVGVGAVGGAGQLAHQTAQSIGSAAAGGDRPGGVGGARQRGGGVHPPGQTAQFAVGGGGGHIAGGVAGGHYRAARDHSRQAPRQVAQTPAGKAAGSAGGHRARGITVGYGGAGGINLPHQAADKAVRAAAGNRACAGGGAVPHIGAAVEDAHQAPGFALGIGNGHRAGGGAAGHLAVDPVLPHQAAGYRVAGHIAGGGAVPDQAGAAGLVGVLPHQAAGPVDARWGGIGAGGRGGAAGAAVADGSRVVAQQTADQVESVAGHDALAPGDRTAGNRAAAHHAAGVAAPGQGAGANPGAAGGGAAAPHIVHTGLRQRHIPHHAGDGGDGRGCRGVAGDANVGEQAHEGGISGAVRGQVDVEVGNGVPVAVKGGGVGLGVGVMAAEGIPAGAAVPVVVGGVGAAAAVGVEVQVGHQLVAQARPYYGIAVGAAHAAGGAHFGVAAHIAHGEGGPVGVDGCRTPVPVQVQADGVQLGQGGDFNEAVAVGIVVRAAGTLGRRGEAAVFQRRVLAGRSEVPRVIVARCAVHIYIPVGVNARVPGDALQLGGGLALAAAVAAGLVGARGRVVPIAVGDPAGAAAAAHQPAQNPAGGSASGAVDPAPGVAGGDGGGNCAQEVKAADQAADPSVGAVVNVDIAEGVAGDDLAGQAGSHQPAGPDHGAVDGYDDIGPAGVDRAPVAAFPHQAAHLGTGAGVFVGGPDFAGGAAGSYRAKALPHQGAGIDDAGARALAVNIDIGQAHAPDDAAPVHFCEQTDALPRDIVGAVVGNIDEQVVNDMAVALKDAAVTRSVVADRRPALAGVEKVAGVVGVHGDGAAGDGVGLAVPVGVKVQVGYQLVARADGGAAHAFGQAGESGGVRDGVVPHHALAVAVQVVADGVQLGQGADFNQVVVVGVIVHRVRAGLPRDLPRHAGRIVAVFQQRVLRVSAEVPRVVVAGFPVQIQVPAHIDVGGHSAVGGGGAQLGGGFAHAGAGAGDAGGGLVPIAVGYLTRLGAGHQGAHQTAPAVAAGASGYRPNGIAGGDDGGRAGDLARQTAQFVGGHAGAGAAGGYGAGGVGSAHRRAGAGHTSHQAAGHAAIAGDRHRAGGVAGDHRAADG